MRGLWESESCEPFMNISLFTCYGLVWMVPHELQLFIIHTVHLDLPEVLLNVRFAPSKYDSHHHIWECSIKT